MDDEVRQRLTLLEEKLHKLGMDLQESLANLVVISRRDLHSSRRSS